MSKEARNRLAHPLLWGTAAAIMLFCMFVAGVFAVNYFRYQKIIQARLGERIFASSAKIYAAPYTVSVGQTLDVRTVASELRSAGYTEDGQQPVSTIGSFRVTSDSIDINPGPESYHRAEGARIHIGGGKVDSISAINNSDKFESYELEPQLLTGLFDQGRAKRRLITYEDMPKVLVDAIVSIEDRQFFQHRGINYYRLAGAAIKSLRPQHRKQGGSTITMQLARGFFLNHEKNLRRKLTEMMIATELEQRLSKRQILELYVNFVDMGQRGSFNIKGLGEGAEAYLGKDLKSLTLADAALLAGIINGPDYYSPYRHAERTVARRNLVLQAMYENGAITEAQAAAAKAAPLKIAPPNVEASDAPYFVDLLRDQLLDHYNQRELNEDGYRIYTTLNHNLQEAASAAIEVGMKGVDALVAKQHERRLNAKKGKKAEIETDFPEARRPQVALIALDPQTGQVLALCGGRNYGESQFNHATAKRPTGSIFKPFVYAAAMQTAVDGSPRVFTPASILEDVPTSFPYDGRVYRPRNLHGVYHGPVSASYALAHSLNNATVKLAEETGYGRVAELAKTAGIRSVRPTPAMALGAYDATPLEMAGAYTIFANAGVRVSPTLLRSLRDAKGEVIEDFSGDKKPVLDPRVTYVLTRMMEGVLDYGTAITGVRGHGFGAPAAGKTGTSHDAWFAGYTSNLLCIVWVGNDDYTDVKLEGANSAAPIWAEFMKRAIALPQFKNVHEFTAPPGTVDLCVDKKTGAVSTVCPNTYPASFVAGTEPHGTEPDGTEPQSTQPQESEPQVPTLRTENREFGITRRLNSADPPDSIPPEKGRSHKAGLNLPDPVNYPPGKSLYKDGARPSNITVRLNSADPPDSIQPEKGDLTKWD